MINFAASSLCHLVSVFLKLGPERSRGAAEELSLWGAVELWGWVCSSSVVFNSLELSSMILSIENIIKVKCTQCKTETTKIVTQTFTNPSLLEKLRSGFDQIAKLVSIHLVCRSFLID